MTSATLVDALSPFKNDYRTLFTPDKVLRCKEGEWRMTRILPKKPERAAYLSGLIDDLCKEQFPYEDLSNLALRINELSERRIRSTKLPPIIYFNSKSKEFQFLSNFHPSVIFLNGEFFPTAEHAYQKLASRAIDERGSLIEFPKGASYSPLDAKHIGAKIERIWEKTARPLEKSMRDASKIQLMKEVVRAKFTQNATLRQALNATLPQRLVEDTSDPLFGGKEGGRNELGLILEELRASLSSMG